LLDHPSARWLDALDIETIDDDVGVQPLVDVLARAPRSRLRELTIGEVGAPYEQEIDEICG
jgi:hypothetical protein